LQEHILTGQMVVYMQEMETDGQIQLLIYQHQLIMLLNSGEVQQQEHLLLT